jgi:hypothetical protein
MANETCILQIQGGLGKHLYLTAAVQVLRNNFPSRDVICVVAWPELFANLPGVKRVYPLGGTQYFYDEYIEGKDPLIFAQEVYFDTQHVLQRSPLIETWCKVYGLPYNGEKPYLKINPEQKKAIRSFYEPKFEGKPLLLIHTAGDYLPTPTPTVGPETCPWMWQLKWQTISKSRTSSCRFAARVHLKFLTCLCEMRPSAIPS